MSRTRPRRGGPWVGGWVHGWEWYQFHCVVCCHRVLHEIHQHSKTSNTKGIRDYMPEPNHGEVTIYPLTQQTKRERM